MAQFKDKQTSIGRKFKNYKFGKRVRTLVLGKRSIQPKD